MITEELIEIASTYGEYIANNSKQVNDDNKLQYYLCGSLATMIYGNATELSYCNIENNAIVQVDDSIQIPQGTRDSLKLFARPMGDIDVLNLDGNMMENSERVLKSNGIRVSKLNPRTTTKQIPNIGKLFKSGMVELSGPDVIEGINNSVNNHRVCKVKTANGIDVYVASPETIIAHKLEEIINLLGAGKINKTIIFNKETYRKDIKDLITSIDGFSRLYKNDELSKRVADALLEKTSNSHFREYSKYLPKLLEVICRDMNSIVSLESWENNISIENVSILLESSFEKGLERLSDKSKKHTDLIGSLTASNNVRGITLNSQQIDLFNIIDQVQSREDAIQKINEYLEDILQARKLSKEMDSQGLNTTQKIKRIVEEKANNVPNKEDFLKFLYKNAMQIRANWDTRDGLEKLFEGQEIDSTYIDEILNIKKYFAYQTHGILTFLVDNEGHTIDPESTEINIDKDKTYQKVQALYDYVIGSLENGENRFTRLTLDGQGKFGTVAGVMSTEKEAQARPEDYNLEPLRQGYEFAKTNGMNEVYINALVFFKDFPDRLVGGTKEQYETALINYGKAVASVAKEYETQGIHTVVDMFNEFVDYNAPFSERTNNWMSKLSIEDLCKIASIIKEEMPNADLGYNDWNFENPEKRKTIFEVIRKIQEYEKENGCKILDHIGTQCHTSINDIEGLRESIEQLQQFGVPIDITELDISKGLDGVNYEKATPEELTAIRKYEEKLQNDVMKMISDFVKDGKIRSVTSWSITDELCADFCDGKEASVTGMTYDSKNGFTFFGKDMDKVIEITQQEIQLTREHKSRVRENSTKEINQNPTQDFCFHTHTQRCGHGAKDTGDEEWIQNAIKGGIRKLAFTDHIPMPDGYNKIANSRMDIAEVESYLTSIYYLQEKYKGQIEIESGFEFEYSDRDLEHLQSLKTKTDKMILGQHFVIDTDGREYGISRGNGGKQISDEVLEMYGASIISAMDKGLPYIIAHPDLFVQARDNFGKKEEEITRAICRKAIEKGIPLEINFGKIASKLDSGMSIEEMKERTPYPSPEFWKIVAEETAIARENGQDLLVIYGKDAHFPGQLSTEKDYEIAKAILEEQILEQLHIVTSYKELEDTRRLTWRQIGKGTTRDFSSKPKEALDAIKTLETGVRTQGEIKEGQIQGEE